MDARKEKRGPLVLRLRYRRNLSTRRLVPEPFLPYRREQCDHRQDGARRSHLALQRTRSFGFAGRTAGGWRPEIRRRSAETRWAPEKNLPELKRLGLFFAPRRRRAEEGIAERCSVSEGERRLRWALRPQWDPS